MNSLPSFWQFLCGMLLLSGLAVTAQPIITDADQVLGPVPAEELPASGTFWFVQQHQPPLPWNPFPDLPVYLFGTNGGHFLVDDSQLDYAALREAQAIDRALLQTEMQLGIVQMSSLPEPPGGGGGGYDSGVTNLPVAYSYAAGSFYIELVGVTNGTAFVALHGTVADELYQVFSKETLTNGGWIPEGEPFLGQDSLTLKSLPILDRTNSLFLRAMSWQDSDGSGMPDWWQLQNFGHIGVDPYADPDGDGWVNMQEYQNGTHPQIINMPPAPTGLNLQFNGTNCTVLLNWHPSPGLIDSYTVEKDGESPEVFTVTGVSLTNSVARSDSPFFHGPQVDAGYRVRANYHNGAISDWSERKPVQRVAKWLPGVPSQYEVVPTRNGQTVLLLKAIPADTKSIRILRYGLDSLYAQCDVPVESFVGGKYVLPNHMTECPEGQSVLHVQALGDGWEGSPSDEGVSWNWQNKTILGAMPFVDGRRQLKENLEFIFRAANREFPLFLRFGGSVEGDIFSFCAPTNYVSSSFYSFTDYWLSSLLPVNDELTPFRDNFIFRNLAFDPVFLDLKGRLLPESDNAQDFYIAPAWPPRYLFNQVVTNGEIITSLLSPSESKWVYMAPRWISEDAFGIYPDQSTGGHRMEDDVRNVYGLPIVSEVAAWGDSPSKRSTIHPGGYLDGQAGSAFIYAETARPALETTEYLFYDFSGYWQLHLPGQSEFDPHDTQRPLLITGIGKDYYYVYGWAKQSLLNGYPGVYGFLGQYFEQALVVGPSGEITTNSAGLLTEYGDFFSTYPGQAALITMPDLDTGERGTGIVHVIKLQLDVNHDGNMELDLTSPDNTSEAVPFRFWVNNDWDYSSGAPDVGSDKVPGDRDCRNSRIESQRDLEDFARLWICGVPSLPTSNGYQVTLSWADVSRGHPTLRLFKSVETNGGTDYLTQPATAAAQSEINSSFSAPGWSLGTVSPSQAFTFEGNLFSNGVTKCLLFEGVENGYGRLILTISKNGQTIATTDAWLDLRDIKNMYQRVRVTPRDPNGIPSPWTFATTFNESLASVETGGDGLDFIPAVDEERKVTVFVHGSNLSVPSAIENAETMFKRLYWQGYKGRFALFYWNTLVGTWDGAVPAHYNYNEFRAFKYGLALKNYVETELPANYTKNVIGHSMGNVVIASALYPRGNMPGMSCRNVIMMQAAIPASCFDPNIAVLAELANLESPEKTPDFSSNQMGYRGLLATNINCTIYNAYNAQDYALGWWIANQRIAKPEDLLHPIPRSSYLYRWSNATGGSLWNWILDPDLAYVLGNQIRTVSDPQESMAFLARSRTEAVGRVATGGSINITNNFNIGLNTPVNLGGTRADHSGQFTRPIQQLEPFYAFIYDVITTP